MSTSVSIITALTRDHPFSTVVQFSFIRRETDEFDHGSIPKLSKMLSAKIEGAIMNQFANRNSVSMAKNDGSFSVFILGCYY
jgi:hypothetical protein